MKKRKITNKLGKNTNRSENNKKKKHQGWQRCMKMAMKMAMADLRSLYSPHIVPLWSVRNRISWRIWSRFCTKDVRDSMRTTSALLPSQRHWYFVDMIGNVATMGSFDDAQDLCHRSRDEVGLALTIGLESERGEEREEKRKLEKRSGWERERTKRRKKKRK